MQLYQLDTMAQQDLTGPVVAGTDRVLGQAHSGVFERIEVDHAGTGTLGQLG